MRKWVLDPSPDSFGPYLYPAYFSSDSEQRSGQTEQFQARVVSSEVVMFPTSLGHPDGRRYLKGTDWLALRVDVRGLALSRSFPEDPRD